jgi:PelA/Pel-15E family pectate lyase
MTSTVSARTCRTCGFVSLLLLLLGASPLVSAAIIGTNPPAWKMYLERSKSQLRADQRFLQNEMREHDMKGRLVPPSGSSKRSIPLNRTPAWYGAPEGRRLADIVVSFQTPAGGWSKNLDLTRHPRAPGEEFAPDNGSSYLGNGDFDAPHGLHWSYVGTFDNDATTTELRYLAKVMAAVGPIHGATYRAAFLRGLNYIFAAQYPNGGWPQVWPLQGGYHDAITCNDGAMINVISLLRSVSVGTNEFAFVPEHTRALAASSLKRGIECLLTCQIVVNGRRTVWGQQYDALTLLPTSARNYEMPSQVASESAGITMFLMDIPHPSPQVAAAVHAAAAWFESTKISDLAYRRSGDDGRRLIAAPGSGPLWARYYDIGTDRPIFGDRDKSIHDDVNEISKERRNGYAWYVDEPRRALDQYAVWKQMLR